MAFCKQEHTAGNRRFMISLGGILVAALLIVCLPAEETLAASGLKLYNYATKQQTVYKDKQVKVTYNGKKISVDSTPGILVNGIALVSYKDIFANSAIKANCVYDKSKGTVTISKSGTTIVLTIGSKKATVNGKSVTMSVAPAKYKFVATGVTKILVPSRFVCETFGFGYTWNSSTSTVSIVNASATASLSLSYDSGKKFDYSGTQGAVTVDGKQVSLGNMPSIINNNTAMLRAKRVFADSPIQADYTYDKNSKTVTLQKNGRVLVMTIGSSTGYLNGTAIKLDRAPMIIYNYETKASYVMVPGNNTANSLGYDYVWNNGTRTSIITSKNISTKPEEDNNAPELGDSGSNNTGLILSEWSVPAENFAKSSGIYALNEGLSQEADGGVIFFATRDYTNTSQNAETYMLMATTPFGEVISSRTGQQIRLTAGNKQCSEYTYQIYGSSGNYINSITTANRPENGSSEIEFNVLPLNYSYDISLSEDRLTLFVTVYVNSITGVTVGTNDQGDYLTLTGLEPLTVNLADQNGTLLLELPYTANGVGSQNSYMEGAKYLNLLYSSDFPDKTQIILGLNGTCKYTVTQEGSQYTIFLHNISEQPPVTPPPVEEDTVITDKSKYEIIIPKPSGISKTKITDYDDYYNNRFSIKLPGDYTAYLSQYPVTANSKVIKDISVFLNSSNETEIRITTTKLQGYEYVTDKDNIYIHIGNPRDIYPNIVILDPGHGGPASGAQYFGTKEKDFNLKMLYELGKNYFNSDPSKLKVYYTRMSDVDLTLAERAAYASKMGADLFVSLHMNASTASSAYGTEVYYSNNNNSPNSAGLTSKKLAEIFVKKLTDGLGTLNRGAKAEKYTVVHKNTVPAVLIELGFMSNKNDFAKLSDPVFQDKAVRIIYETMLQVFEQYPTGR